MILFINSNEIWSRLYLLDVYIKTRGTFNVENLRERSWCIQNVNRILLYCFWRLLINVNYKRCRLLMSGHYRASILPYIVTSSLFINHSVVILILKGLTNELLYAQAITFLINYWSLGKLFLIAIEVTNWEVTTLQISNNTKLLRIHHPCWYIHTHTHTQTIIKTDIFKVQRCESYWSMNSNGPIELHHTIYIYYSCCRQRVTANGVFKMHFRNSNMDMWC